MQNSPNKDPYEAVRVPRGQTASGTPSRLLASWMVSPPFGSVTSVLGLVIVTTVRRGLTLEKLKYSSDDAGEGDHARECQHCKPEVSA